MLHDVQMGKRTRKSFSRIQPSEKMSDLIEIQKDSFQNFVASDLSSIIGDFSPIDDFSQNMRLEFLTCYLEGADGKPVVVETAAESKLKKKEHDRKEELGLVSADEGEEEYDELSYRVERFKTKYSVEESKERDATFAAPMKVKVRLTVKDEDGSVRDITEQDVFMGDFPLMTRTGTFIINGAERVITSQLVRSPGVYFEKIDRAEKQQYTATLIPNRGAWLEFEIDKENVFRVKVDRTGKVTFTTLLRALSPEMGSDEQIIEVLGYDKGEAQGLVSDEGKIFACDIIRQTLKKDQESNPPIACHIDGLTEMYKKLRPGENATVETMEERIADTFFDPKRYDLSRVGRYKFNKKLSLAARIEGQVAFENIVNPETGELLAAKGDTITAEQAKAVQNSGIRSVRIIIRRKNDKGKVETKPQAVLANRFVEAGAYLDFDPAECGLNELVYYPVLREILDSGLAGEELKDELRARREELIPEHILLDDILSAINYGINLCDYYDDDDDSDEDSQEDAIKRSHTHDDIDHLGNRRVRCVGELLQNQLRVGFSRMERVVRERMSTLGMDSVTPSLLINIRPVTAAIKEFFGSSQLSQFMDQNNPLAELTHKRRLSALGPGGLNRDRPSFEVRDVHYTHYGRMCPIETPEGKNIGLIGSLATYARINQYGFIETPYRRVEEITDKDGNKKYHVMDVVDYLTADQEDGFVITQANEPLDENNCFINERVAVRGKRVGREKAFTEVRPSQVDYVDVSPCQVVSVATAMIPFLENDDASRALMGANMQRQAVPLLCPQAPIVATGIEYKAAQDSGVTVLARKSGTVTYVDATKIVITDKKGREQKYDLLKFKRSNQGTCINQRPIVKQGEQVAAGQTIADGPSTDQGEISLGRNMLIAFMPWEGYNYEDAVLLSEKLVKNDIFTSIHIEKYECEARDTKLGPEEITQEIPNIGEDSLKNLDENGVIRIGAEVRPGDILVGKVTPKGETEMTAEERLLRAIFGEKARETRDTSLRVPHGEAGIIVDVKTFTRENKDELSPGVSKMVRVYIAQKRKISVGDKMAGRHGNKGVISRILPEEDMPFLPDGTPVEIVLNPLGVPSRMNVGQVLEVHLGMAARKLGWHIATPVFDGAKEADLDAALAQAGMRPDGKTVLYDGRTGEPFDNPVTVGIMYYLKLVHLVDDKIHARSTGPYSLVTQQPLGGKAQFGGQRFGEMEVWALYAYGAAHTLQEILTIKSDDVVGRVKAYEAIIKGENIPEPGIPESFKVLLEELRSLALDVKILTQERKEVHMRELLDDDADAQEFILEGIDKHRAPEMTGPLVDIFGGDDLELDDLDDEDAASLIADDDDDELDLSDLGLFDDDEEDDGLVLEEEDEDL